jgi:hypothetical protein
VTNNELWAVIDTFPEYEVSTCGRVRKTSLKGVVKVLKPSVMHIGYMLIGLRDKKKAYVHRLVATAFISNPEAKSYVNHMDMDRTNNNIWNLEWVTHRENCMHARGILGNFNAVGTENGKSKINDDTVRLIRKQLAEGIPHRVIAAQLGISRGPVSSISLNIGWKHVK